MTTVSLAPDLTGIDVDALVVGVIKGEGGAVLVAPDGVLPPQERARIEAALRPLGVRGAPEETTKLPAGDGAPGDVVALVGLGAPGTVGPAPETVRRAAGAALRALTGTRRIALALPAAGVEAVAAAAEGALLGSYSFRRYRTGTAAGGNEEGQPDVEHEITVLSPVADDAAAIAAVRRAEILARAVNAARDLVNTPPLDLYPESFAQAAAEAAEGTEVTVTTLDHEALLEGGYGGLIGVGQGSSRPPRLVRLGYAPEGARAHVALVGKGITFDSGGLSIKPAKAMETMKCDMAGAAAVLHTVVAAAALELPVQVTGWLALAENMPSGTAQRPSDVITIRGGKTVEVLNTDAEGRLVLADALVAAGEEDPDTVIDIATLTGAQMIALGNQVSAVMGTEEIRTAVVSAADGAGEAMWPMPLPEELKASLKSAVADLANMGDRFGGMLVAACFLQHFVGTTPWAHLDIAGPAFNEGAPRGYTPKGGTGVGVRTLLAYLESRALA